MEKQKKYSDEKLQKFEINIKEKISKAQEELRALQRQQLDQKKYIAQADMSFSDDSRRFQNRAMLDRMVTRLKKKVSALESALLRIENKTYGVCKRTDTLISEKRLMIMPTAILSIKAKKGSVA
jgi:RNA polymerase-binding transcription factor DksA